MTTASIGMWVLIALIVFVLILVKKSLVIIPQSETKIIERLGKYYATLKPGINVIIPFIDRPKTTVAYSNGRYFYTNTIDLREQVYDFDKQNVITKDNVQTQINALLYFQIVEPESAVYEINNLPNAIEKRRDGAGPDPHLARHHQHQTTRGARRRHQQVGREGEPC